jgi:hypothetical protein
MCIYTRRGAYKGAKGLSSLKGAAIVITRRDCDKGCVAEKAELKASFLRRRPRNTRVQT